MIVTRRSMLKLAALGSLVTPARPALAQMPGDGEWKKIIEGARKEGKVVMYSGAVGTPVVPKLAAAFETA